MASRGHSHEDDAVRKPTSYDERYGWYEAAVAGKRPPITHETQCGYFTRRMVKGGPLVPVRIWLEQNIDEDGLLRQPEVMKCLVNGKEADADDQWTYVADNPVTPGQYDYLLDLSVYAKRYNADEPLASPRKAINHLTTPIPEFKSKRKKRNG